MSGRDGLEHVLWLAGGPDSGKTTLARLVSERRGLELYRLDAAEPEHVQRVTAERQPAFAEFLAMSTDDRWVNRSAREMADQTLRIAPEVFELVLADLRALPNDQPILVEGAWLFPGLVAPWLSSRQQAVWLIPSVAFKRASALRRDKPGIRHGTSDPERAAANWLERDRLLAREIERQARELGLRIMRVSGSRPVEEMAAMVEGQFAQWRPTTGG
jgi:hypothetical protein